MKIDDTLKTLTGLKPGQPAPAERKADKARPAQAAGDQVKISADGEALAKLKALAGVAGADPVRLAELERAIAAGTYAVDPRLVAGRLLDHWQAN